MNIENLSQEEIKSLYNILGKMLEEPKKKKIEPVDKMIEDILEEFDFNKVRKAMWHLDWKWSGSTEEGTPTVDEMKKRAKQLLQDAAEHRLNILEDIHWEIPIMCSTGGFEAKAWCDEDKSKIMTLQLQFVLTDQEAFYYQYG
jgi:hypothetical protein